MIHLFPERMLDGSIHTAILVGVVVLWLMTETLGYVFAGFVVTGYLAAIAIVAPMSLVCIVVEAVLTYGIVWTLAVGGQRLHLWSRIFGRERFLLFLLVSIPVRLVVEGLAAPGFEWLLQPLWSDPVWRGARFFGIGIVLVPLLANVFWKPGMVRGGLQVLLSTTTAWAFMRFVLMKLTNFQFGGFELIFEHVAVDFLQTPKAYIILITTAFVAAHNNVRFGWDFGGILIPALLAIVALTPLKLAVTFVEIAVLVWLYRGIVALPWIRDLNLEGPRRIVSMYTVSYGMKWGLAMLALRLGPDIAVSDLYGFGYLLTSLVAVRCFNKNSTARTLVSLFVTVIEGAGIALGISLLLTWAMPPIALEEGAPLQEHLEEPMARSVLLADAGIRPEYPTDPAAESGYSAWVAHLARLATGGGPATFPQALAGFRAEGLDARWAVRHDGTRCLSVRAPRPNAAPPPGLPALWWCGGAGPGLYVPRPLGDPDSLWTAAWLADQGLVSFVVVAGIDDARTALLGAEDPRQRTRWSKLRDALGPRTVLVLRTVPTGDSWLDPRSGVTADALREGPHAHAGGALSAIPVHFETRHGKLEPLWKLLRREDGLLTLSTPSIAARMAKPEPAESLHDLLVEVEHRPEHLRADPSTPAQRLASAEVLLGAALRMARDGPPNEAALQWIATRLGVRLRIADDAPGHRYWILDETDEAPVGFGTWVIRPGAPGPWLVIAPWSTDERGTGEMAALLWRRMRGEALWISGHGERFGVDNPLNGDLRHLPFAPQAIREVLRPTPAGEAVGPAARLLLVRRQIRRAPDTPDLVVARGEESVVPHDEDALRGLLGVYLTDWPGYGFVEGDPSTTSLNGSGQFPIRYLNAMSDDDAVIAWFAPSLLGELSGTTLHAERTAWYASEGVPVRAEDMHALGARMDPTRPARPPSLYPLLRHHVQILDNASIEALASSRSGRFTVVDTGTRLVGTLAGAGWLCTATAGAPDGAFPWNGCWRTR